MATQRTIVLNDFGLERRERTNAAGAMAARYSVSIDAAPMVHTFDAKTLGRAPAAAIVSHLRTRVTTIGQRAAPATIAKRAKAAKALAAGEPWALTRYSGGRMGTLAPAQSEMLFNDSGRFSGGLVASPTSDNQWTVNMPANRFDPTTFDDGEAGVLRMFEQLRALVPEFGNATQLAAIGSVKRAIADSIELVISRSSWSSGGQLVDFSAARAARLDAMRRGLELLGSLAA